VKHDSLTIFLINLTFVPFQDQAQTACFSSDGEVIVIGMTSGKWMVLDASTREVFGIFQDGSDAIQVFTPKHLELRKVKLCFLHFKLLDRGIFAITLL
jgi:hypothetical protein